MQISFDNSETIKNLLLDNEELLQTSYYGLMKHAKHSGLLDKDERLYFVGESYTINLIPQALLLLGWLACNTSSSYNININPFLSVVGFLVTNLGQEYVQSSHDSYSYYSQPPASYHSPSISASYQPPLPYKAPSYSAPSSSYSAPSSYSAGYSLPSDTAYVGPSEHHNSHSSSYVLPSLTSYTIQEQELDTLSYGDTLTPDYQVNILYLPVTSTLCPGEEGSLSNNQVQTAGPAERDPAAAGGQHRDQSRRA